MFIDGKGFIYITGPTKSADFPVTRGAFDTTINDTTGNTDATKQTPKAASMPSVRAGEWSPVLGC